MSNIVINASGLSIANAIMLFEIFGNVAFEYSDDDIICIRSRTDKFDTGMEIKYIVVEFAERDDEYLSSSDDAGCKAAYTMHQPQYFPTDKLGEAINCFIARLISEYPSKAIGKSYQLEEIGMSSTKKLVFLNHWDYINCVLDKFWLKVFGKTLSTMQRLDIVGNCFDDKYRYREIWKEAGIDYHHGVLLYGLTHTNKFGNTPKNESGQWVIDNYKEYLPIIETMEKEILSEKYGIS